MLSIFTRKQNPLGLNRLCRPSFFLVCLLLTACASSPAIPMPKDENDTLLIIRLGQRKAPGADTVSIIELKIDSLDKPIILKPWIPYAVISGLAPGKHETMTLTFLPNTSSSQWYMSGGNQKPEPKPFTVPFVMKPGTYAVFPVKFVYVMEIDSVSGMGKIRWDFVELSEEDRLNEAEKMKNIANFPLWQLE